MEYDIYFFKLLFLLKKHAALKRRMIPLYLQQKFNKEMQITQH